MNDYSLKFRYVIVPLIIVVISTSLFLSLLHLLGSYLNVKAERTSFVLALIIPIVPVLYWYRPKLKILSASLSRKSGREFYMLACWGITFSVAVNMSAILVKAISSLNIVKDINEISEKRRSKYYEIKQLTVFKTFTGIFPIAQVTGKGSQNLELSLYITTALLPGRIDTTLGYLKPSSVHHWCVTEYHKTIDNKKSGEYKEARQQEFYEQSLDDYNRIDFTNATFFERLYNSKERDRFVNSLPVSSAPEGDDIYVVLKPHYEPFIERYKKNVYWMCGLFTGGILLSMLVLPTTRINYIELKRRNTGGKRKKDKLDSILEYIIPKGNHFVASIILIMNIFMIAIMFFGDVNPVWPKDQDLLYWGGMRASEVVSGDWWRLFLSLFIQAGIWHFLLNMAGLIIAAAFTESIFGRGKFFIIYIVSGVLGGLLSIWWHEYGILVSVGASGAIFGLVGSIISLAIMGAYKPDNRLWWLTGVFVYLLINLIWGLKGGVDNAANIGGLATGIVLGGLLYKPRNKISLS